MFVRFCQQWWSGLFNFSNRRRRRTLPRIEALEERLLLTAIFSEDFEGAFPGANWTLTGSGGRTWDDTNDKSHFGNWSGYGADLTDGTDQTSYTNNLYNVMARTVDLSDYRNVNLGFYRFINTQASGDGVRVEFSDPGDVHVSQSTLYSGNAQSWQQSVVPVPEWAWGHSGIKIKIIFNSNSATIPSGTSGVWIDDILLEGTRDVGFPESTMSPISADLISAINLQGNYTSSALTIGSASQTWAFGFNAEVGGSYTISTGLSTDTQLRVYDYNGDAITPVIDGTGTGETTTLTLIQGVPYYIQVGVYNEGTGQFTLSINGPSITATSVNLASSTHTATVNGSINTNAERDYYQFVAPAGTNRLSVTATPSTGLDTRVTLFSSTTTVQATSPNNSSGQPDSLTSIAINAGQTYYVMISSEHVGDGENGPESYSFTVNFDPDDYGDPPATLTNPTSINSVFFTDSTGHANLSGEGEGEYIDSATDLDLLAYYALVTGVHSIEVDGSGDGLDVEFRVYNEAGNDISGGIIDLFGSSNSEYYSATLTAGNWYYFAIAGHLADTGAYSVAFIAPPPPVTDLTVSGLSRTVTIDTALNESGDVDYYRFVVPSGATSMTLTIDPSATWEAYASLSGGGQGFIGSVSFSDDPGDVLRETYTVSSGQTYTLTVSGDNRPDSGTYSLKLDFDPDLPEPNSAPSIPQGQVFNIDENAMVDLNLGQVVATDPNVSSPNNVLTYSILSGTPSNAFSINPNSGQLLVANAAALDFETTTEFTLSIQVTDGGGLTATQNVTITLNDLNEDPAIPPDQVFEVLENSPENAVIGTLNASDPDLTGANAALTYSILSGDPTNPFSIDPATGEIRVVDPSALNYETTTQFVLNVKVVDGGDLEATQSVTINITDVNESPSLPANQSFNVPENTAANVLVGTVAASDPDNVTLFKTLTYSIDSSSLANAFTINPTNGEIRVGNIALLNFETTSQVTLQVKVSDGGGLSVIQPVVINISDVNEAPSIPANQTFGVLQNSPVNSFVGTLAASDPDTTASNNTLAYAIISGVPSNPFTIDSSSGTIRVSDASAINLATGAQFTLQVKVTDGGNLSMTQSVVIEVTEVNAAPSIPANQIFSITENSVANTPVGTLLASDPDTSTINKTLTYSILNGTPSNPFVIDAATGVIRVTDASALNYEVSPQFTLQVKVTDGGGLSATRDVVVNVTDVNEVPSIPAAQAFNVAENSVSNTSVGTVLASDPDTTQPNRTLTYSIVSGTPSNPFAIDPATGALRVSDPTALNFESTAQFTLQVKVTDGGNLNAIQSIIVNVSDVNEAPSIAAGQIYSIAETSAANSSIGTLLGSDPDTSTINKTLTYSILSGDPSNAFVIDAATGLIRIADASALNFEASPQFTLQVKVTDGGGLSATRDVVVNVTDVNEVPSIPAAQSFNVAENAVSNTSVGTVLASDPDTTQPNRTLTYSIVSGTPSNPFTIDSASGALSVNDPAALNFESTTQFTLQVKVTDGGNLNVTQSVVVTVSDVNETPSISANQSFTIAENSAANTAVGTVSASDPDNPTINKTLTYSIVSGSPSNPFTIDPTSGQIRVNDVSALNFEQAAQFSLQVKVTDGGGLSVTRPVAINVSDVNEAPSIPANQTFGVLQNSPVNTVVGTVTATDPDTTAANNTLTYSIVAGVPSNPFTIDSSSGIIRVSNASAINLATAPQFTLQVKVTDGGNLSMTQSVVIEVTEVNAAPSIPAGQIFSIAENSAANATVGTMLASDPDTSTVNKTLTYSILNGAPANPFVIDAATGVIRVADASALNFEVSPQYTLQVKVTDGGGLSATRDVVVNVTDVNEVPSIPATQSFNLAENSAINTSVGTVLASDPDTTQPNQTLTYSIVSGTPSNPFAIDPATGGLRVTDPAALNFESTAQFTLQVKVTDGGNLNAIQSVVVTLSDVNEAPSIPANQSFTIAENSAANTLVGTVSASDPDNSTINKTLTYSIVSGSPSNPFTIDPATGTVRVNDAAALNFEVTSQFALQVKVTDGGNLATTQSVTVNLTNVDEQLVLTNPSGSPTFIGKLKTPAKVFPSISISDPGGSLNVASIVLSVSIPSGKKNLDIISIGGGVGFQSPAVATVSGKRQFTIAVNSSVTASQLEAFLRNIAFSSKGGSLRTPSRDFDIVLKDSQGATRATASQRLVVKKTTKK